MEEQIIDFETAKLANEKGFSLGAKDSGCYLPNKQFFPSTFDLQNYDAAVAREFTKFIYAPTQSLLQKWLREKHNIDVESRAIRYAGDVKASYYQPNINGTCIYGLKKYDTYELALEAGLIEGLKQI